MTHRSEGEPAEPTPPHRPKKRLSDRPTPDLIVIYLTGIIGFVIIASIFGAAIWKLIDPSADLGGLASSIARFTNTLIGSIVGYLAGRGVDPNTGGNMGDEP